MSPFPLPRPNDADPDPGCPAVRGGRPGPFAADPVKPGGADSSRLLICFPVSLTGGASSGLPLRSYRIAAAPGGKPSEGRGRSRSDAKKQGRLPAYPVFRWSISESNRWPPQCHCGALPAALMPRTGNMIPRVMGFVKSFFDIFLRFENVSKTLSKAEGTAPDDRFRQGNRRSFAGSSSLHFRYESDKMRGKRGSMSFDRHRGKNRPKGSRNVQRKAGLRANNGKETADQRYDRSNENGPSRQERGQGAKQGDRRVRSIREDSVRRCSALRRGG